MSDPAENQSFATLASSVIIVACQEAIERVNKIRAEEDKVTIEKNRRWITKRKWLFWKEKIRLETDEEVKARLLSSEWYSPYPSIRGWGVLDVAKKLTTLAKESDVVNVTSQDWSYIK